MSSSSSSLSHRSKPLLYVTSEKITCVKSQRRKTRMGLPPQQRSEKLVLLHQPQPPLVPPPPQQPKTGPRNSKCYDINGNYIGWKDVIPTWRNVDMEQQEQRQERWSSSLSNTYVVFPDLGSIYYPRRRRLQHHHTHLDDQLIKYPRSLKSLQTSNNYNNDYAADPPSSRRRRRWWWCKHVIHVILLIQQLRFRTERIAWILRRIQRTQIRCIILLLVIVQLNI